MDRASGVASAVSVSVAAQQSGADSVSGVVSGTKRTSGSSRSSWPSQFTAGPDGQLRSVSRGRRSQGSPTERLQRATQ